MKLYKVSDKEFINVDAIKKISVIDDENERGMTPDELEIFGEEFKRYNFGIYVFSVDIRVYLTENTEYDEGIVIFRKTFECPAYMSEKALFSDFLGNSPKRDKITSIPAFREKYEKYITMMETNDEKSYVELVRKEAHEVLQPKSSAFLEEFIKKYQE